MVPNSMDLKCSQTTFPIPLDGRLPNTFPIRLCTHETFFFLTAEYTAIMDCTAYSGYSSSGTPTKFLVDDG